MRDFSRPIPEPNDPPNDDLRSLRIEIKRLTKSRNYYQRMYEIREQEAAQMQVQIEKQNKIISKLEEKYNDNH